MLGEILATLLRGWGHVTGYQALPPAHGAVGDGPVFQLAYVGTGSKVTAVTLRCRCTLIRTALHRRGSTMSPVTARVSRPAQKLIGDSVS